jgi:hypothetical protein
MIHPDDIENFENKLNGKNIDIKNTIIVNYYDN